MESKEKILEMFRTGVITIEETIELLSALDNKQTQLESVEENALAREKVIENAVNKVVDSMEMEKILEIMTDMEWKYYDGPVTLERIIEVAKYVTRTAINDALKSKNKEAFCDTGGFESKVWIDDTNELNIEINFIPYSGYIDIEMDKLSSNK